jgi:aspartyl-tRNA(Asn)/glutamyl-tRNA(Gln) amidotransferase subunit A
VAPALDSDLAYMPMTKLAEAIAAGDLSASYLVDHLLARIEQHDPKLHAFVTVYADEARLAAEAADRSTRSRHRIGILHGIPIALKDVVELEGRVTGGGSQVWRNRISSATAMLAKRLIAAGMVVLGKTHTVEFGMGGWGTNRYMGTPWNPWDMATHRTPGGSSAGSGVAVAAGLVPGAIGTDAGGSVRLPASWCGVTGLKTTVGRVNMSGVLPLSTTLDSAGPIARTVEDVALLYDVMAEPDPGNPLSRCRIGDPISSLRKGIAGIRLAVLPESECDGVASDVLANFEASIQVLQGLGAQIVTINLPARITDLGRMAGDIIACEAYSLLAELVDRSDLPIDDDVRSRICRGREFSARDYLTTLRDRTKATASFVEAFRGTDALLTPTTATAAIPVEEVDQNATVSVFTRFVNLLDLCALAQPNGFTREGLPTSLQVIAARCDEAMALRIGFAFEHATDWHTRIPPGIQGPGSDASVANAISD